MSALPLTSPSADSAFFAEHTISTLPVLVIFPHSQCNCRCVMCDIWRSRETKEITPADLQKQLSSFRSLGISWVVFSGGEPQMNEQWGALARMLRAQGIRVTMLTAGLLLKSQADSIVESVDDLIISLDGPPAVHNNIRRVSRAFEHLAEGVIAVRRLRPDITIRARCTVQKANHQSLCATVQSAKELGLNSISFLAADLTSAAFNRQEGWISERQIRVVLSPEETDALEAEMERLISNYCADLHSGFVVETAEKLRRIVRHFRAHLGQVTNLAPRCNAPWVSAVIEASGDVRPCFFHPAFGNIHKAKLPEILNGPEALRFRANLDMANNQTCQRCVCSLHIPREQGAGPEDQSRSLR
jgi:Fe-coproporphyrin III synthase